MAATTASPPAIPPRPSRSQEKASSTPLVPPRPTNRRLQRSVSPNPDRFAPSPLNEILKSPKSLKPGPSNAHSEESVPTLELPSLGEEGKEYAGLAEAESSQEGSTSPKQTRTVAEDLKLHAPKPSLPASSAKQRVMAVTRTDSERAASFGIGRPSSVEGSTAALPSNRSLKKKASTTSQLSATESQIDDEHGIPEIGQQVPMLKNAGDVQAPSPALASAEGQKGKHHSRKTSAHGNLPPGSYGLHGHGVVPQDKLEKAYYDKHPDLLKKEHVPHHYDRPNDFSMSRDDLNKIVRETASRGSSLGTKNYTGTPSDQVGWQALEESTSRIASPSNASPEQPAPIHVDEPNRRKSAIISDAESMNVAEEIERPYTAPILADDEVAKDPSGHAHQPAVEPHGEVEEFSSRPSSRPVSLRKESSIEMRHTPLEDVEEYEPLFNDDEKPEAKEPAVSEKKPHKNNHTHRFPSADIWEDAPSSVYYTAEVSTPELFDEREKPSPSFVPPQREGETPAQAFARHQEELAEKEAHGQRQAQKPLWAQHQKHLATESAAPRPAMQQRFPSRDVWEDAPDSLQLETTVSTPQQEEVPSPTTADTTTAAKPGIPARPQRKPSPEKPATAGGEKPAIPERPRPKPRQTSTDDKPTIPERPKPQIPARPAKAGPTSGGLEPAEAAAPPRQKPAVPARPMGSKIAALQAGFMSDLNRRLQLGPQAPPARKEEEPAVGDEQAEAQEKKEKVPLSDARKGRARGPQRRAPASAVSAAKKEEKPTMVCGVVAAVRFFEIDPDEGALSVGGVSKVKVEPEPEPEPEPEAEKREEKKGEEKEAEKAGETKVETSSPPAAAVEQKEGEEHTAAVEAEKEEVPSSETKAEPKPASEVKAEPEAESEPGVKPEAKSEPEPEAKTESNLASASDPKAQPEFSPEPKQETKSLATNMAGETLIKEDVVKKEEEHEDEVEPVKVTEN